MYTKERRKQHTHLDTFARPSGWELQMPHLLRMQEALPVYANASLVDS